MGKNNRRDRRNDHNANEDSDRPDRIEGRHTRRINKQMARQLSEVVEDYNDIESISDTMDLESIWEEPQQVE